MLYLTQVTNQWRLCFKTPLKQGRENPCAHTGFLVMARRRISCPAWVGLDDLWLGDSFVSVLFIRLKWATHKRKWSLSCSSFDLFRMHWVTKTNVSYSLMCYGLSLWFLFGMFLKRKNILKTMQVTVSGDRGWTIWLVHTCAAHWGSALL